MKSKEIQYYYSINTVAVPNLGRGRGKGRGGKGGAGFLFLFFKFRKSLDTVFSFRPTLIFL